MKCRIIQTTLFGTSSCLITWIRVMTQNIKRINPINKMGMIIASAMLPAFAHSSAVPGRPFMVQDDW